MKGNVKIGMALLSFTFGVMMVCSFAAAKSKNAPAASADEVRQKVVELKKLEKENPQEYKRIIEQRKEEMRQKLELLKQQDPAKYEEIRRRMVEAQKERLKSIRENDPDRFRQIVNDQLTKLKDLQARDPKRYAEVLKNNPSLARQLENMQMAAADKKK